VIGSAIALKLLFNIPLIIGVLVTALDVIIILAGFGVKTLRAYEIFIVTLVATIGVCFIALIISASPRWEDVARGYVPRSDLFLNRNALYNILGIVGATVCHS
jgi:manganese transport protein